RFLILNQKPDRRVASNSAENCLKILLYPIIMTEKAQLSEENVIFVKNKLHDQLSLGAEPQNGSGWLFWYNCSDVLFYHRTQSSQRRDELLLINFFTLCVL
ncbi:MAG: hypothetical protein DRH03_02305, partial [Deltaproteobacteria bacterium]